MFMNCGTLIFLIIWEIYTIIDKIDYYLKTIKFKILYFSIEIYIINYLNEDKDIKRKDFFKKIIKLYEKHEIF